jgi:CpeT/CpcT family (DUF1001)
MVSVQTVAGWLAGEFDNQQQAQEQPVWFVPLRLWHRPLPFLIDGSLALFCEQANFLQLNAPYRQRVLILRADPVTQMRVEYRAFQQPERVKGAGANPTLLQAISVADLEILPGCELTVQANQDDRVKASSEPGAKCCFQYNGQTRQVILGFEASADEFWSFDRGVDPDTGQLLWGAMMGAYKFQKRQSFATELLTL